MQRFNEKTTWVNARETTLFTAATLRASARHEKQAKALEAQLAKWDAIDRARQAAADRVTRAHALIAWSDYALDFALKAFANELLRDAKGDANDKLFRAYFDEAPSEVIRLGVESELARIEPMFATSEKVKLSKTAASALALVKTATVAASKAIVERKAAFAEQASVALDMASWKESTDAARVSIHVQLQSWAVDNGEDRLYAERFYSSPERKSKRKATPSAPPAE